MTRRSSQDIPDIPYAAYAQLIGLKGIVCTERKEIGAAWDEALACETSVVLEFKVDPEIPPIPPHIKLEHGTNAAEAAMKDPEKVGIAVRGIRQKLSEVVEKLPGRDRE